MLTICDSICVKIIQNDLLIAARGNSLTLHGNNGYSEILPFKLANKVHGIEYEGGNRILVFGEKEFLYISFAAKKCKLICRYTLSDWISSAKLLLNGKRISLITGHSVTLELEFSEENRTFAIAQKSSCEDKSTLYCSTLTGNSWENLIAFGGNAFGEILIWKPSSTNVNNDSRVTLDHRIPAHQGVLFSINVDFESNLMVTTSDDRSIRFWNVDLKLNTFAPYKSGYAHTARVFQGKIIKEVGLPYIVSVGEDSNICLWNQNGELLFKRKHHFGATIWNFDYHEGTKTAFSASSDGNILKYSLEKAFCSNKILEVHSTTLGNEYLTKVKFLPNVVLVGITNQNNLVLKDGFDGDWKKCLPIAYKCTVLQVYNNFVALAGYKIVTIMKFNCTSRKLEIIFEEKLFEDIIRSFCFLDSENEFLACTASGECKIVRGHNFKLQKSIQIPNSKEKWITTAFKIESFLVCSNRQGNLYLYVEENNDYKLKATIKNLHGNLAAMSIILRENGADYFIVNTCGHDSTVKSIFIQKVHKTMKMCSKQSIPVTWIERVCRFDEKDEKLYLLGFNDNHFVLWERDSDIIFEISCGGGHRCWDAQFNLSNNEVTVIFIKNKKLFKYVSEIENVSKNNIDLPRTSWHIRPCNVLKVLPDLNRKNCAILFSAGEENILKISKYAIGKEITLQAETSSHISSIKTLKVLQRDSNKYLVFSAGGRAQLCFSEYNAKSTRIEEICSFMLKSSDYDRRFLRNQQEVDFDPETRFMSLDVLETAPNDYRIFIGCSDGYLRIFQYEHTLNAIKILSEHFYNRCLLHVRVIGPFLVTAATDGKVCFWALNGDFSYPLFSITHHESGINSFDITLDEEIGTIHLLTGGDDQSVVFSKIEQNFKKIETKTFLDLHTAQVTGVKFSPNCDFFYSIGIDQMLNKVKLDSYEPLESFYSCISDVKGIDLLPQNDSTNICFIYACGLQTVIV